MPYSYLIDFLISRGNVDTQRDTRAVHTEERPSEDTMKMAASHEEASEEIKPANTLIMDFWHSEL